MEGLFLRLDFAVSPTGAERIVLDTIVTLFGRVSESAVIRNELRRLFGWLKEHQLNAIIIGEDWPGGSSTQDGLKEYVADCVIVPDNRVYPQSITRRRQVVKYRGLAHGTDEYPFLIRYDIITVMPRASPVSSWSALTNIISTGVSSLDATLHRRCFFQSSSILFSDGAGAVKTSTGSHFVDAAGKRGERRALFKFEGRSSDYCPTAMAVGIDLNKWIEADLLRLNGVRQNPYELEMHLAWIHHELDRYNPSLTVIDPISTFFDTTEVRGIRLHQRTMPCSLTGSARLTHEVRKQATKRDRKNKTERRQRAVFRQEETLVSQITIRRVALEEKEDETAALLEQNDTRAKDSTSSNSVLSAYRAMLQ